MHDLHEQICLTIPVATRGQRLDKVLARLLPHHSRANLQRWLKSGAVKLNGAPLSQKYKVAGGEAVVLIPPPAPSIVAVAQPIAVDVVAADEHFYVINKPAGLVVHPGAGNADHTLLNGLLHLDPNLHQLPRAGIVHRLDKDTSGLLVVARSETARQRFIHQLKCHEMQRQYLAVVNGVPVAGETISQPIGRHRHDRLRMCVTHSGKPATTHIRVAQKYRCHSLIRAHLVSGRTHQIRVHLQWRGYALVGDTLYGGRVRLPLRASQALVAALNGFRRQALHAQTLAFNHPHRAAPLSFEQPLPADMQALLQALQDDAQRSAVPPVNTPC